ncbi:LYR motif-containing protein 4 [Colletes gigas]|uniref:LYR motif-containing protein 4 n=1 Tax=Colletes gigas TaxID=935657 RepID=UPI001C9AE8DB|nr:LYR motif-containing protein 4 [Colletes gigas]
MADSRNVILNLYRSLIRESKKWSAYNYRMYALRKIRHEFQENKALQDRERINEQYEKGQEMLEVIKRQVTIGNFYATKPLIIENIKKKSNYN